MNADEFIDAMQKLNARFNSGEIGLGEWTSLVGPIVEAREKTQATERAETTDGEG